MTHENSRRAVMVHLATALAIAVGFGGSRPCLAGFTDLGSAGDYAVLGLTNASINNSLVTINGNEGIAQGGTLTNMAPSVINGNVYESASGQYSGPGHLNGGLITAPATLTQNVTDALNAATQNAALAPTQTFGSINSATTITGNGGLNVIDINGSITNSVTLTGTSNDIFVVNVTGGVSLVGSTALGLGGGVTANHVLYNFTGNGITIATHVGNVLNGTLLAPNGNFNLDGTFNGEIIGGGNISMLSGAVVNHMPLVPEPSSVVLLSLGGGLAGLVVRRRAGKRG